MARADNSKNLKTPTSEQARINGRKGGLKSAAAKRERKTIKILLETYLESNCKDSPQLDKLASKMGLKGTESIKQLFTMACVLNSIKEGNLKDLGLLQELLGENILANTEVIEDDPLTKALKEEAEEMKRNGKR